MSFKAECAQLAPLETFDPAVFEPSGDVSQEMCDFVLALALIYNDCKDLVYANLALVDARPAEGMGRTRCSIRRTAPPLIGSRRLGRSHVGRVRSDTK
jgi:hypothetical protein